MRKIPTVFMRDPEGMHRVLPVVTPGCEWVLAGEGVATRKYDGTCVMFDGAHWWARREVKPGKREPENFEPVEHDEATGKTVGWEPVEQSPFARFHAEAVAEWAVNYGEGPSEGTYELCGPKVNGNPEGYPVHVLVPHAGAERLLRVPRDFEGLWEWLSDATCEGIVWHHEDGRMAKLKRRDFRGRVRPAGSRAA